MSPTISIADVLPISLPFSGSTDASGNFTFSTIVRVAYWSLVKVVAQAAGMGTWTISVGSGQIPLDFATGPRLSAGPFVVGPGDTLQVSLVNGTANTNVIGTYWGTQHPNAQSAALSMIMAPNPLTVGIPTSRALTTLQWTQGFQSTFTFNIPSETLYLQLIPTPSRVGFSQLAVSGHQTGAAYYPNASIPFDQQTTSEPILVGPIDSADDTSIDIQATALTGGIMDTFKMRVVALFSAPSTFPGEFGQRLPTPPFSQTPNNNTAINQVLNGGASIAPLIGRPSVGLDTYLHELEIFAAGGTFTLTGATSGHLYWAYAGGTNAVVVRHDFKGLRVSLANLGVNEAINFNNTGANPQAISGDIDFAYG